MRRLTPVAAALGAASSALAQESPNIRSATLPSPGNLVLRLSGNAYLFNGGGALYEERLRLATGIIPELGVEAQLPFYQSDLTSNESIQTGTDATAVGLGDLEIDFKLRILRLDTGPVDTFRLALLGGLELPTSTAGFGSSGVVPNAGVALNWISGRHGVSANVLYRFTTGKSGEFVPLLAGDTDADVLEANLGYLFRVHPAEYGEEHVGAWYATAELLTTYETNGDVEMLLTPGLLSEGPRWAFEATVGFPVWRQVEDRPEANLVIGVGVRFLF
jgi:hypothetical protein